MSTEVEVPELPPCDLADAANHAKARYDARTAKGPWAYLCEDHWRSETNQVLGTGHGQRLITSDEVTDRETSDENGNWTREKELEHVLRSVLDIHDALSGKSNRWSRIRLKNASRILAHARDLVGERAPITPGTVEDIQGRSLD